MGLKDTLKKNHIGSVIFDFDEVDSTNDKAHYFAQQGFREGTVIIAKRQRKGRGRRGNHWYSPVGGLYCSSILRPNILPKDSYIIERLASICVYETVANFISERPQYKQPNDILIKGKKVAGILTESRVGQERVDYIIVGIGINCLASSEAIPAFLKERITTLAEESGCILDIFVVLEVFLDRLNHWYNTFLKNDTISITQTWEKLINQRGPCPICY